MRDSGIVGEARPRGLGQGGVALRVEAGEEAAAGGLELDDPGDLLDRLAGAIDRLGEADAALAVEVEADVLGCATDGGGRLGERRCHHAAAAMRQATISSRSTRSSQFSETDAASWSVGRHAPVAAKGLPRVCDANFAAAAAVMAPGQRSTASRSAARAPRCRPQAERAGGSAASRVPTRRAARAPAGR